MEISGQRLSIPRNFLFLNRLPARFEILVVARGAQVPKGTAFELEIQGQRLVLHSKIDLKVGARYDLEKISAFEFRILNEKAEEKRESLPVEVNNPRREKISEADAAQILQPESTAAYADLLALRVLEDSGGHLAAEADKYLFTLEAEVGLRGVFVQQGPGRYTLFVTGSGATARAVADLTEFLSPLGIGNIRAVSPAVLDRISAGAVDIRS